MVAKSRNFLQGFHASILADSEACPQMILDMQISIRNLDRFQFMNQIFKSAITNKRPICFLLGGQVISLFCDVIMIMFCMSSHAAYLTATLQTYSWIPNTIFFPKEQKNKQLSLGSPGTMGPVYWRIHKYIYIIPRTQMTLVLIEKGLVLEGWPSKIEASWVLGIYTYI